MAWIRSSLGAGKPSDPRLRVVFVGAHEILRRRAAHRVIVKPAPVPQIDEGRRRVGELATYAELVPRVCAVAERALPAGAAVLVATRGDHELLRVGGGKPGHFPQDDAGAWAGFYPADGDAAIRHVEQLIARGYEFLLFPATAFWWLEYYAELDEFLARHADVLHRDADCVIFDLRPRRQQEVAA